MRESESSAREPSAAATTAAPAQAGAGVLALRELLARGAPKPEQVVALIDAHRGERDQLLATLQTTLGNGFVQEVVAASNHLRASVERREVVAGDPARPDGGFFVASQAERGARWRTASGDFTGTVDRQGLDSHYRIDDATALHGTVTAKTRTAALGLERDGHSVGELYGHTAKHTVLGGDEVKTTDLGVRRGFDLGDGATAELGARHQLRSEAGATTANDGLGLSYAKGETTADVFAARARSGGLVAGASGATRLDPRTTLSGSLERTPGPLEAGLAATRQLDPHTTASAGVGYLHREQGDMTTLALAEHHGERERVHDAHLTVGTGQRDYVDAGASVEAPLRDGVYGSAFGSYHAERGQHPTATAGTSLTFTVSEKTALTLAGIIDEHGTLETRLQLDVFKSRIDSVQALSDHKRAALVSLFVSYSKHPTRMLDDRLGGPQLETQTANDQVMFGFRVKF